MSTGAMADDIKQCPSDSKAKARTEDVRIKELADFSSLLLSEFVLSGLKEAGFEKPSPIQLKAIPLGRCGLDLIVQAKSGTGKTCVFSVVALESIMLDSTSTQVLILAPTREIAVQIWEVINTLGKFLDGLRCYTFIGGMPIAEDKVKLKKCHIAVGTPGRVKQLIENQILNVESIRLFVLDEADKLLEEGFQESINWIYSSLPENKQMLALSATYPEVLAQHLTAYMRNPTFVRLNATDPALLGIRQYYKEVPFHPLPQKAFEYKCEALVHLLGAVSFQQCLVFSNYQLRAQSLSDLLNARGWPATYISGSQEQQHRLTAMAKLKRFKCRILISTDLTSRGIDAENVDLVVNLDLPYDHDTYLHRIGRAGRFGTYGAAVTFVSIGKERANLKMIEGKANTTIKLLPDPISPDLTRSSGYVDLEDYVTTEKLHTTADLPSGGNEVLNGNHIEQLNGTEQNLDDIELDNVLDVLCDVLDPADVIPDLIDSLSDNVQTAYDQTEILFEEALSTEPVSKPSNQDSIMTLPSIFSFTPATKPNNSKSDAPCDEELGTKQMNNIRELIRARVNPENPTENTCSLSLPSKSAVDPYQPSTSLSFKETMEDLKHFRETGKLLFPSKEVATSGQEQETFDIALDRVQKYLHNLKVDHVQCSPFTNPDENDKSDLVNDRDTSIAEAFNIKEVHQNNKTTDAYLEKVSDNKRSSPITNNQESSNQVNKLKGAKPKQKQVQRQPNVRGRRPQKQEPEDQSLGRQYLARLAACADQYSSDTSQGSYSLDETDTTETECSTSDDLGSEVYYRQEEYEETSLHSPKTYHDLTRSRQPQRTHAAKQNSGKQLKDAAQQDFKGHNAGKQSYTAQQESRRSAKEQCADQMDYRGSKWEPVVKEQEQHWFDYYEHGAEDEQEVTEHCEDYAYQGYPHYEGHYDPTQGYSQPINMNQYPQNYFPHQLWTQYSELMNSVNAMQASQYYWYCQQLYNSHLQYAKQYHELYCQQNAEYKRQQKYVKKMAKKAFSRTESQL